MIKFQIILSHAHSEVHQTQHELINSVQEYRQLRAEEDFHQIRNMLDQLNMEEIADIMWVMGRYSYHVHTGEPLTPLFPFEHPESNRLRIDEFRISIYWRNAYETNKPGTSVDKKAQYFLKIRQSNKTQDVIARYQADTDRVRNYTIRKRAKLSQKSGLFIKQNV